MMGKRVLVAAVVLFLACGVAIGQAPEVTLENEAFVYTVGPDGRNVSFVDKNSGADVLDTQAPSFAAQVKKGGAFVDASSASYTDGRLTLGFGDTGIQVVLNVRTAPRHMVLEVASCSGDGVEELAFLNVPLVLKGTLDEPTACAALALDLQTNVAEIPGPMNRLRAACYPRFGLEGAEAAVVAGPQGALREVMKEVVTAAPEIPRSDIGGPFALDAQLNRGSYLFDFGQCTEQTVDQWIALVQRLGLRQIDFHTGRSLRFGDCQPAPDLFPNGRASVKAVLDKLHAAGIAAGLHTYAFFIAKDTPYVTPVPDPRLGKFASYTLSEPILADATAVPLDESTADVSTITGFFVRNSVTVQIDNELITFAGVSKEAPYGFTQCTRGAFGTTAAAHEKGAKVHHLRECFGLFTPDADSTLLAEIAANTADTFNECGFDMIYLDALDGEDILGGSENSWHYGSKFTWEIAKRLNKPALFEMSTFHHHLWYVRARMGAWDHPTRSHKEFIDIHAAANLSGAKMFLPMNLGWWSVKVWNGPRMEPTYPDDIEYLLCKAIGTDASLSLMGVNPGNIDQTPAYQRLAPMFRQYEDLRLSDYFPQDVKDQLREPGAEFTLEQDDAGKPVLRRVQYHKHKVTDQEGITNAWRVANAFDEQPLRFRLEALSGAAPYDSPDAVVIEDFSSPEAYTEFRAKEGVSAQLVRSTEQVKSGEASGCLRAASPLEQPVGAWAKLGKMFEPMLNLDKQQALGVWVHGDGQGELLNIQLHSPSHIAHGLGDRYIPVDFTGWRYFELIENEGGAIDDWGWPYGGQYAVYREDISYANVDGLNLWYNNLPKDAEVSCFISPIKALPLADIVLKSPSLTVNGRTVTLPVEIPTGCYVEFNGMNDCTLYGKNGETLQQVVPEGDQPVLTAGENEVALECGVNSTSAPRARVSVVTVGERVSAS